MVTGALSVDAAKGSDGPFDARIHALRRHRGQIDVAAALRGLMTGSAIATLPLLVLFAISSRQLIAGLTAGAVK